MHCGGSKWPIVGRRSSGVFIYRPKVELMFLGEFNHSIDDKGRITIPAVYRQLLEEGAYITLGFDNNLMVLRNATFENLSRRLNKMNLTDPNVRELRRLLFSNAQKFTPDASGRILIPPFLREYMGLNGEIVLIGGGSYFELWSQNSWKEQSEQLKNAQKDGRYFSDLELFAEEDLD